MQEYHAADAEVKVARYVRPYTFTRDVFVIPRSLARYAGLSATAKLVYTALAAMSNGKNCAFPQIPTIAREIGSNRDAVMTAIKSLVDAGFLEKKRRYQQSNLYYFLNHEVFQQFTADEQDKPEEEGADQLWQALVDYMGDLAPRPLNEEIVAQVRQAGRGATDQRLAAYLRLLRKRYEPCRGSGPHDWGWFPAVIRQRFGPKAPKPKAQPPISVPRETHQASRAPRTGKMLRASSSEALALLGLGEVQ